MKIAAALFFVTIAAVGSVVTYRAIAEPRQVDGPANRALLESLEKLQDEPTPTPMVAQPPPVAEPAAVAEDTTAPDVEPAEAGSQTVAETETGPPTDGRVDFRRLDHQIQELITALDRFNRKLSDELHQPAESKE